MPDRRRAPQVATVTIPAATPTRRYHSARVAVVSWALSPLGFGTAHSSAPPILSGCRPSWAFGRRNAER